MSLCFRKKEEKKASQVWPPGHRICPPGHWILAIWPIDHCHQATGFWNICQCILVIQPLDSDVSIFWTPGTVFWPTCTLFSSLNHIFWPKGHQILGQTFCDQQTHLHLFLSISHAIRKNRHNFLLVFSGIFYFHAN